MISIYICEDMEHYLKYYMTIIKQEISVKYPGEMEIKCATGDPLEVLADLQYRSNPSLYFLDIDLGPDAIDGLSLGTEIRKLDPCGYIVIITTYDNMYREPYERKLEAVDFIVKDQPGVPERIVECLEHVIKKEKNMQQSKAKANTVTIQNKESIFVKKLDDIYAIQVDKNTHQLIFYGRDYSFAATMPLKEIRKNLNNSFFQINKSVIINLDHVVLIKINNITMENNLEFSVSTRRLREIKKIM